MYEDYYGLEEKPFKLSPDPRFLFLSASHREALAHLLYGIDQAEGFITVTGEVGTGKTTLCRTLLERLGAETEVAFLFNPSRSATELLQAIGIEFGLPTHGAARSELGDQLNRFLLEKNREGKRVLLIIDEAQNLSTSTLEQVRLLSNLETSNAKLIQILLLGQPELDRKLDSSRLRQLRQRISVRWSLGSLSARETAEYVRHRVKVAAGGPRDLFTPGALKVVHRLTGGVPRLINVLCDRSLLAGYGTGASRVTARIVREAAKEIPDAARRQGFGGLWNTVWASPWARPVAAAGVFGLAVVAGLGWSASGGFGLGGERSSAGRDAAPPSVSSAGPATASLALAAPPVPAIAPSGVAMSAPEPIVAVVTVPETPPAGMQPPAEALADEPLLIRVLRGRDARDTRRDALDSLLASYRLAPSGASPAGWEDAVREIESRGLRVHYLPDTDFEMLRALNHPVLLRLDALDGGGPHWLSLLALEDELASCFGITGQGPMALSLDDVDELWTGEALVVWRPFDQVPPLLAPGAEGAGVVWLQSALIETGFSNRIPTGSFDNGTAEDVRSLQIERGLLPDGVAGPQTQMVLYDMLGRYAVPRLHAQEGEAG